VLGALEELPLGQLQLMATILSLVQLHQLAAAEAV
jgi:hypothetical protein